MTATAEPGLYRHTKSGGLYRVIGVVRRVTLEAFQAAAECWLARDATDLKTGVQNLFPPLVHVGVTPTGELVATCGQWREPSGVAVLYVAAKDGQEWVRDLAQFAEAVLIEHDWRVLVQRFERVGP